jgi:transcriptional regulator with XRE-family HTH domain
MTSLKKLLALNMKEHRRILDISQSILAERVDTSTHYIAMIELERKTPSLNMIERIARALQIDPPELFSVKTVPSISLRNLHKSVLQDIEKAVGNVFLEKVNEVENDEGYTDKIIDNT